MKNLPFAKVKFDLPAGRQVPFVGTKKLRFLRSFFYFADMYTVYAIKSSVRNYIYVGLTDNIERRFSEHQSGYNKTTAPYKPYIIIYTEIFATRSEARKKEIYLKSGIGKEFLRSLKEK